MEKTVAYNIRTLFFKNRRETLVADFYQPIRSRSKKIKQQPTVIMAHGFAGERKFGLPKYAHCFAEAGYQVVLFDYRGFGGSTGKPRELVSPKHHVSDWAVVLKQVQKLHEVDANNIALWGVAFSSAHILTLAAKGVNVRCLLCLLPFVDGLVSSMAYPKALLPQATALALRDIARSSIGMTPVRVPVVAKRGVCCLTGKDCYQGYMETVPEGSAWIGQVPARILLTITQYRPIHVLHKISCPVQMITAKQDSLLSFKASLQASRKIRHCEPISLPIGHFDVFNSAWEDKIIQHQLDFLAMYMPS